MHKPLSLWSVKIVGSIRTSLSSTHLLSSCSGRRQCHSCWLLLSKHLQCFRNSSRQFLLMSSKLHRNTRISLVSHFILNSSPSPTIPTVPISPIPTSTPYLSHHPSNLNTRMKEVHLHTSSTPRNLPSLPHTINLPPPPRILLALHIIIIECATTCTNKE